jgi:hypothetical protein
VRRFYLLVTLVLTLTTRVPALAQTREYVSVGRTAGVVTRPASGPLPHVAIIYDNGPASPQHPMCTEMTQRGFLTWCAISSAQQDAGDWTEVALEVKTASEYLRRQPGLQAIVLYGHSGGGAVASFYEAVAENGVQFCQDPRKFSACNATLSGLPKADAIVFPDAHPGMDVMSLRGLNPSLIVAGDQLRVDPMLDPFSPQNGFNPRGPSHYSPSFQKRYYDAQADEMRALTKRAQAIESARNSGALSNPADELVVIPGFGIATHLDELDPSIDLTMSSVRPERLLRNDGSIVRQLIHSVWTGRSPFIHVSQDLAPPAHAFLAVRAVRAQDSMTHIDWCSANSDTVCNASHIHVPVLFIAAGASDFIADEERMFDASPAKDKEYLVVEGALHSGAPCKPCETAPGQYANSEKNQYDYIARWINERLANGSRTTGTTPDH